MLYLTGPLAPETQELCEELRPTVRPDLVYRAANLLRRQLREDKDFAGLSVEAACKKWLTDEGKSFKQDPRARRFVEKLRGLD